MPSVAPQAAKTVFVGPGVSRIRIEEKTKDSVTMKTGRENGVIHISLHNNIRRRLRSITPQLSQMVYVIIIRDLLRTLERGAVSLTLLPVCPPYETRYDVTTQ